MTRAELTGVRDLAFSGWIREKLPDSSTGFAVSDIDFVLWDWKKKKVMIVELKTHFSEMRKFQKIMFRNISKWIEKGIECCGNEWEYYGFHSIMFTLNDFSDSFCYLDNHIIKEPDLIKFLSFEQENTSKFL